ncbi:MAG: amino acid permease, partial [Thermoproteus sp.]
TFINNIIQILQIIILIVFSIATITQSPYSSAESFYKAFNPLSAPGGLNGFFLAVILAGFLFYTGYDAPLYLSEESKSPFRDVWRAIAYGTILSALVGTLTLYAEVVGIGPDRLQELASVLNPGLTAFTPYVGLAGAVAFALAAWLGQLMGGVAPGLSAVRELYSLARDRFFGEFGYRYLTKLNERGVPSNSALVNMILGMVVTALMEFLMITIYGMPDGAFYALFLSGSMVVAYWFVLYMIIDLALSLFFKKNGIKILTPRNFLTSIVAPAGGVTVFAISLYLGYYNVPEPYFSGFIFVIASTIASFIYVLIMRRYRGKYWESYISKKVRILRSENS